MKLTETPEIVNWPVTHYVFIEKVGPFQDTAMKAWQTLHQVSQEIGKHCKIVGAMALYKMKPEMIYRAGHIVDSKPAQLPDGVQYVRFEGGKYSKFTLVGSYSNLPMASGKVMEIRDRTQIPVRDDFYIENYANNPQTTPEDQLITEILVPTK